MLALLEDESLIDYAGLEIQTMDITGNYRENWRSYKELPKYNNSNIVESEHGINWANVHKRLIPQLIRKGSVFKKSSVCKKGLHFVLPEVVYQKFEDVIGSMKQCVHLGNDVLSVHTYDWGITYHMAKSGNSFISDQNVSSWTISLPDLSVDQIFQTATT